MRSPVLDEELGGEDNDRGSFVEPTTPARTPEPVASTPSTDDEDDESLSYFAKLVNS